MEGLQDLGTLVIIVFVIFLGGSVSAKFKQRDEEEGFFSSTFGDFVSYVVILQVIVLITYDIISSFRTDSLCPRVTLLVAFYKCIS